MATIRVLIVDDHPMFRDGVRALLNSLPGVTIAGEAANGVEAVAQAEDLQPDVILMDILMPGMNGIEASRRILHSNPSIGILMLTMFEDDESVFAALRVGARGYILKGADQIEIRHAIEAVARGEALFGPAIARRLINFFSSPASQPEPFPELTDREREVLSLMAQGYSNVEIAETFVLSPKTVRNHVSNIFNKLQVADRGHAIVKAREAGLGE
ncbi:MAG: response regulator transcription factor [Anaerolineae bacterium]|nr:response regulator transcription factor [Anaerolineae bacterium]